jgi:hypothetical protein
MTEIGAVRPEPTDDELAAIVAAIEMTWPRAQVVGIAEPEPPRWRFAGRWWTKPVPLRRERPW